MWVSGGKKCLFCGKFNVLCFLENRMTVNGLERNIRTLHFVSIVMSGDIKVGDMGESALKSYIAKSYIPRTPSGLIVANTSSRLI